MQKGEDSRRLGKQHRAKEAAGLAEVGQGLPSPLRGPVAPAPPPLDLDTSRNIYIPLVESHARIHSSSTVEEQRSLRDTILERRVMLVV
jgi:hypothetical protein